MALSEAQVYDYQNQGYVLLPALLDDAAVAALGAAVDALVGDAASLGEICAANPRLDFDGPILLKSIEPLLDLSAAAALRAAAEGEAVQGVFRSIFEEHDGGASPLLFEDKVGR